MDVFKKDVSYLSLLLNFIRSNRHILMKYEPEKIKDRINQYSQKENYENIEELSRAILMAPYLNRFNILARIHFETLHNQGLLDNTLINVLKNRLIYDLTQDESEVGKGKEEQSWLVKLMTKKVDLGFSQGSDKNQLNILYLNSSRGFGAYNLNFEMKYLLPGDWKYSIIGIDPLKENVDFANAGSYPSSFIPPDYSHKDKFSKSGDNYVIKEEHRNRLEFQHLDILEAEPHVLTEKFKEKFDLVVASESRSFYTLPIFFKIVEKVLPMLKVGSYLYTGVENIKDLKNFEHLDILSIDNIAFYRRNRNVIVKNVFSPIKEEEENCNNLLLSATTQFLGDNFDQVLQYTYHILNKEVDNRKAILIRCLALIGKGNYRLAKNMIRQAHILNAMDFDADLASAFVNLKTGDEDEAREDLHNALSHFNFNKIYRVIQCSPEEEKVFLSRWERISNLLGGEGPAQASLEPMDLMPPRKEKKTKTVTIEDERYGKVQIEVEPGREGEHLMLAGKEPEAPEAEKIPEEPVIAVPEQKAEEKPPAVPEKEAKPPEGPPKVKETELPPRAELIPARLAPVILKGPLPHVEDPDAVKIAKIEEEPADSKGAPALEQSVEAPVFADREPEAETAYEPTETVEEKPEETVVSSEKALPAAGGDEGVEEAVTEPEPELEIEAETAEPEEAVAEPAEDIPIEEPPAEEKPAEKVDITPSLIKDPYKTAIMSPQFREALVRSVQEKNETEQPRVPAKPSFMEPSSRQTKGSDSFRKAEEETKEEAQGRSRHQDAYRLADTSSDLRKKKARGFKSDPYQAAKEQKTDGFYKKSFDVVDMYVDPYRRTQESAKSKKPKKKSSSDIYKTVVISDLEQVKAIREQEEKARAKEGTETAKIPAPMEAPEKITPAAEEKPAVEIASPIPPPAEAPLVEEKLVVQEPTEPVSEEGPEMPVSEEAPQLTSVSEEHRPELAVETPREEKEEIPAETVEQEAAAVEETAEAEPPAPEEAPESVIEEPVAAELESAAAEAEVETVETSVPEEPSVEIAISEPPAVETEKPEKKEAKEEKPEKPDVKASKKREKKFKKGFDTVEIPDFSFKNPFSG